MSRFGIIVLTLFGLFVALCMVACIVGVVAIVYFGGDIPEPDVSDLALERPAFAEEDNAYAVYERAISRLDWPEDDTWMKDYLDGSPVEEAQVSAFISRNAEALDTVRQANTHTHCAFPFVSNSEVSIDFEAWRRMVILMSVKARHERLSGRFTGAADAVEALLHTGRHIHPGAESMMVHLTGERFLLRGVSHAADLAKEQDIPRELLDRLATALDQYPEIGEGVVRALKGEFQSSLLFPEMLFEMDPDDDLPDAAMPKANHVNYPLAGIVLQTNRTMRDSAELHRQLIAMVPLSYAEVKALDWQKQWEIDGPFIFTMLHPNFLGRLFIGMHATFYYDLHASKCWTDSQIAGTRLLLALIRHKADTGTLPDDLQALVPQYIESIPADPYDGEPFRYSKEKGIVYAVGIDLVDSGGSMAPLDYQDMREHIQNQLVEDVVFPIS